MRRTDKNGDNKPLEWASDIHLSTRPKKRPARRERSDRKHPGENLQCRLHATIEVNK